MEIPDNFVNRGLTDKQESEFLTNKEGYNDNIGKSLTTLYQKYTLEKDNYNENSRTEAIEIMNFHTILESNIIKGQDNWIYNKEERQKFIYDNLSSLVTKTPKIRDKTIDIFSNRTREEIENESNRTKDEKRNSEIIKDINNIIDIAIKEKEAVTSNSPEQKTEIIPNNIETNNFVNMGKWENSHRDPIDDTDTDRKMRELADASIVEYINDKSSSKTTLDKLGNPNENSKVIMLARNSELANKPLTEDTKQQILANKDKKFIVGNSYIDKPFIDYLEEINADYTMYGYEGKNRIMPENISKQSYTIPRKDDYAPLFKKQETLKMLHKSLTNDLNNEIIGIPEYMYKNLFKSNGELFRMDSLTRNLIVSRVDNEVNPQTGKLIPYRDKNNVAKDVFDNFVKIKPFGNTSEPGTEVYAASVYHDIFNRYPVKNMVFEWNKISNNEKFRYDNGEIQRIIESDKGTTIQDKIRLNEIFDSDGNITVSWIPKDILNSGLHRFVEINRPYTESGKNELISKAIANVTKKLIPDNKLLQGQLFSKLMYSNHKGYQLHTLFSSKGLSGGTIGSPIRLQADDNYIKLVSYKYGINEEQAKNLIIGETPFNMYESIKFAKENGVEPYVKEYKLTEYLYDTMDKLNPIEVTNESRDGLNMSIFNLKKKVTLSDIGKPLDFIKNMNIAINKDLLDKASELIDNKPLYQWLKSDYDGVFANYVKPAVQDKFAKIQKREKAFTNDEWSNLETNMLHYLSPDMVRFTETMYSNREGGSYGAQAIRLTMMANIANAFEQMQKSIYYINKPLMSKLRSFSLLHSTMENEIYRDLTNVFKVFNPNELITTTGKWSNGVEIENEQRSPMTLKDIINQATLLQSSLMFHPKHLINLSIPIEQMRFQKDIVLSLLSELTDNRTLNIFNSSSKRKKNKINSYISNIYGDDFSIGISALQNKPELMEQFGIHSGYGDNSINQRNINSQKYTGGYDVNDVSNLREMIKNQLSQTLPKGQLSLEDLSTENPHIDPMLNYLRLKVNFNSIADVLQNIALQMEFSNDKLNTDDPERYTLLTKNIDNTRKLANELTNATPLKMADLLRKRTLSDGETIDLIKKITAKEEEGSLEYRAKKYYAHKAIMNQKYRDLTDYGLYETGEAVDNDKKPMAERENTKTSLFNIATQYIKTAKAEYNDYERDKDKVKTIIIKNVEESINKIPENINSLKLNIKEIENSTIPEDSKNRMMDRHKKWISDYEKRFFEYDNDPGYIGKLSEELYNDALENVELRNTESSGYYNLLRDMGAPGFEMPFERLTGDKIRELNDYAKNVIQNKLDMFTDEIDINDKTVYYGQQAQRLLDHKINIDDKITLDKILLAFNPALANDPNVYSYNLDNLANMIGGKVKNAIVQVENVFQRIYNDEPDKNIQARFTMIGKLSRTMSAQNLYVNKIDKERLFTSDIPKDSNMNLMVHTGNLEPVNIQGRYIGTTEIENRYLDGTVKKIPVLTIMDDSNKAKTLYIIEKDNILEALHGEPYPKLQKFMSNKINETYKESSEEMLNYIKANYYKEEKKSFYRNIQRTGEDEFGVNLITNKDFVVKSTVMSSNPNAKAVKSLEYRNGIGRIDVKVKEGLFTPYNLANALDKYLKMGQKATALSVYLGGQYPAIALASLVASPIIGLPAAGAISGAMTVALGKRWSKIVLQNFTDNAGVGTTFPTSEFAIGNKNKFMMLLAGIKQTGTDMKLTWDIGNDANRPVSTAAASVRAVTEGTKTVNTNIQDALDDIKQTVLNWNFFKDLKNISRTKQAIEVFDNLAKNKEDIDSYLSELRDVSGETIKEVIKYTLKQTAKIGSSPMFINENIVNLKLAKGRNIRGEGKTKYTESVPFINDLSRREYNNLILNYSDYLSTILSGKGYAQHMELVSTYNSYNKMAYKINDIIGKGGARERAMNEFKESILQKAKDENRSVSPEEIEFINSVKPDMSKWLSTELEKSLVWKSIGNYVRNPAQSTSVGRMLTMFGNFNKESGLNQTTYMIKRKQMYNALMEGIAKDKEFVNYMEHIGIPFGDWYLAKDSITRYAVQGLFKHAVTGGIAPLLGYIGLSGMASFLSQLQELFFDEKSFYGVFTTGDSIRMAVAGMIQSALLFMVSNAGDMNKTTHKSNLDKIIRPVGNVTKGLGGGYALSPFVEFIPELAILTMKNYWDQYKQYGRKTETVDNEHFTNWMFNSAYEFAYIPVQPFASFGNQVTKQYKENVGNKRR